MNTSDIINALPHDADTVVVKLKRKLNYRSHVYFESVYSESVSTALKYLKERK